MFWLIFILGYTNPDQIRIEAPQPGVFAGRVPLRLDVKIPKDDILGVEVLANDRVVVYFEEPPFESEIDFRELPPGDVLLKAVVTLFDGRHYETTVTGTNHPNVYEEEVNLIRIPVLTQANTKVTMGDVQVFENGRPQKLERVMSVEQPLELLVLLDVSGSMEKRLFTVRRGMQRLMDALQPEDRMQVVAFNHAVFEVVPSTTDREETKKKLNQLDATGETNLYGAVWSGIRLLSKVQGRRALVVFTDGRHELTRKAIVDQGLEECLESAQTHGVPIYTMGCGAGIDPEVLGQLATDTGGKFFRLMGNKAIQNAFSEVGQQLRQQYLVCYQTKTSRGGWHGIEIKLKSEKEAVLRYPERVYIRKGL